MAESEGLGERLADFWSMDGIFTRTKTRNTRAYGYHYLSGILRLESERTIAPISRTAGIPEQNRHHSISASPWSHQTLLKRVREDIVWHPHFAQGSMLLLEKGGMKEQASRVRALAARTTGGWAKSICVKSASFWRWPKTGYLPFMSHREFASLYLT